MIIKYLLSVVFLALALGFLFTADGPKVGSVLDKIVYVFIPLSLTCAAMGTFILTVTKKW